MWTTWTRVQKQPLAAPIGLLPVHIGSKKCGPDVDQCGPDVDQVISFRFLEPENADSFTVNSGPPGLYLKPM